MLLPKLPKDIELLESVDNKNLIIKDVINLGVPRKFIKRIKMTLEGTRAALQTCEGMTEEIEICKGVRQGDSLPITLLNVVIDKIVLTCELTCEISRDKVELGAK